MKKFLTLAVFLLTLLPAARVSAQNWVNESMHECEDEDGFKYMTDLPCEGFVDCRDQCSSCNGFFDCDEIEEHEKDCFYECNKCNQKMKVIEREKHKCKGNTPETDQDQDNDRNKGDDKDQNNDSKKDEKSPGTNVSRPIHEQNLPNVTVNGKNKSGSPLNWWDWTYVIGGGGNGSSNNSGNGTVSAVPEEEQPLRASQQSSGKTNSIGYHRCPCMISPTKKSLLDELKNHPLYNHDNGYPGLTKDLERQLAFPEIIQQGNNGTCGPAFVQKYLAENYPEQYADCVYYLANYGYYAPWGLWLDTDDRNPIGITQDELYSQHEDANWYKDRGINYTAVDAIMQSAIQTWTNNNDFYKRCTNFWGITHSGYDPRIDSGRDGGMSYDDVSEFIENEITHDTTATSGTTKGITYDLLDNHFQNANHDDYTIYAGVNIAIDEDEGAFYFGNKNQNHIVELTGTDSGKYEFWSYGRKLITSKVNGPIHTLLFIKNTLYAKIERATKRTLVCNCNYCTGDGCCLCMSE